MELYHEYTERLRNNAVAGTLFKKVKNYFALIKKTNKDQIIVQVSLHACTAYTKSAGFLKNEMNKIDPCCQYQES